MSRRRKPRPVIRVVTSWRDVTTTTHSLTLGQVIANEVADLTENGDDGDRSVWIDDRLVAAILWAPGGPPQVVTFPGGEKGPEAAP